MPAHRLPHLPAGGVMIGEAAGLCLNRPLVPELKSLVLLLCLAAAPAAAQIGRVPVQPMAPESTQQRWVPSRIYTEACVNASRIAAAEVMDHRHIDLVIRGGERVRLILQNDCPQLTFYGGFYYSQAQSGMICAGRDRLMGRAGGSCRVRAIARLKLRK